MKKFGIYIISLLLLLFIFQPLEVLAGKETNGYSVSIETTTHQVSDTTGYFDLMLKENESDRLPIIITNNRSEEATFSIKFHTATTNSHGIVDYTLDDIQLTGMPNTDISNLVTVETDKVTVAAYSQATVFIGVQMPATSFEGILLGGVQVSKEDSSPSEGLVSNKYQYVIAVQLTQSDTKISPELKGGKVFLTQYNALNAVGMNIENTTAVLLPQMTGTFTIKKKGKNDAIVNDVKEGLSIAPNSSFQLVTLLGEKFIAGSYTYTITLNNTIREWSFSNDFTITDAEVKKYNKTSVDPTPRNSIGIYIVSGLSILISILSIIVFISLKKRNKFI